MTGGGSRGTTDGEGAVRHSAEQARTLAGLLRAGASVLAVLVLVSPFSGAGLWDGCLVYGTGLVLHLAHLAALRLGRTRAVAISHCLTYLVWVTGVLALRMGGLRAPAALVYPPLILMAGLVWSGRAALGMAFASSAIGAALVVLERQGLLPTSDNPMTPLRLWLVLTACVVITAVILRYALGIIRRSTEQAVQSLGDRLKADEERMRLAAELRRAQRLEALGRLAGGVAHDFNNLLTIMLGNLSLLPRDEKSAEAVREIETAALRASSLTHQLLAFGRRQVLTPELVNVNEVLTGMETMLRRLLPEDVKLELQPSAAPATVSTDRVQLEQVIVNLVANARDALPRGGTISVTTALVAPASPAVLALEPHADAVWLTVTDDGLGMTEEVKAHVFEPFFTTKAPGHGTGLGLSTVYGIVSQSGGRVGVESAVGRGTSFFIALPRWTAGSVARTVAAPPQQHDGKATILLVEDDAAVRNVARQILFGSSYQVLVAAGATEARTVSDGFTGPIDLLLSDVVLSGGSGPAIATELRERRPNMKILFTSGHAEELVAAKGGRATGVHFLPKPFTGPALLEKVASVLGGPSGG